MATTTVTGKPPKGGFEGTENERPHECTTCGLFAYTLAASICSPHISSVLPDEQATPEQIAILRTMSGERRLQLAESLYWSARKMKAAGLRGQHPDWSEDQVQREVTRIFLHART